jgi:2-iminobutanoate/2-iminopropanoate deaminase
MFNKSLLVTVIVLVASGALATSAACAADAGRNYIVPQGVDPKVAPPFSNGVMVNGSFFVAGHLGLDPATGKPPADPEAESHLVLDAVKATLERAGLSMDDLVSVTIYCTDLDLYDKFNAVYRTYFHDHYPARAFIGVAKLVRGARIEIAGVAVKP